jgi:probable rRNA maturation factor
VKVNLALRGVRRKSFFPSPSQTSKIVANVLRSEKARARGEINIILTDKPTIRRMNKTFLDEAGETDVIAFPYTTVPETVNQAFGDIYIAAPVAEENAERFGDSPRRELVRLIVHGLLHLLGYDDHGVQDRKKMWKRQELFVDRWTQ